MTGVRDMNRGMPARLSDPVLAGPRYLGLGRAVDADQAGQQIPHTRRKGFIGQVHVGPDGIAAGGGSSRAQRMDPIGGLSV